MHQRKQGAVRHQRQLRKVYEKNMIKLLDGIGITNVGKVNPNVISLRTLLDWLLMLSRIKIMLSRSVGESFFGNLHSSHSGTTSVEKSTVYYYCDLPTG